MRFLDETEQIVRMKEVLGLKKSIGNLEIKKMLIVSKSAVERKYWYNLAFKCLEFLFSITFIKFGWIETSL